ncbi:unnamed protein product, partial [marine sediment metagenome]
YEAREILAGNEVVLDSGARLTLVGVDCPRIGNDAHNGMLARKHGVDRTTVERFALLSKEYLTRLIEGEKLAVKLTDSDGDGRILSGYLWTVDDSLMHDPETRDVFTGPMYACVNENVLSNGWGFADDRTQHAMSEKYEALEELAKRQKVGLWMDSR